MTTHKMTDAASAVLGKFMQAVPDATAASDRLCMTSETSLPYGKFTFVDKHESTSIELVRQAVNGQPVETYEIGVFPNGRTYAGVSVTINTSPKTGRRFKNNPLTTGFRRVSETQGKLPDGTEDYLAQSIGWMDKPCVPVGLKTLADAMPKAPQPVVL